MSAITRSASASPCMALNAIIDPSLFPLKSIADVVNLFRRALTGGTDPDLTLLSIVVGYIELSFTTGNAAQAAAAAAAAAEQTSSITPATTTLIAAGGGPATSAAAADIIVGNSVPFPVVTHELVAGLYKKFQTILSVVDKPKPHRQATREIIKKVSDVIWNSLIRSSYKDRAHLQNLYTYLSGNKLDCFGVALAVVAGCQLLGYRDVRLAISEDHAWVVFGQKRVETIEVTWHGKGSEDKRGQDIVPGIESGSWLYLGGCAVVCERAMEVAAICSAINISLTSNSDCVEVSEMQQQLLWLLYDLGHLKRYPMAIGSLGELEEINPSHEKITCDQLYREAIESARVHYRNHHVYPYTYQGNYYNRLLKYREAFASWANAADVIRLYTYNCRDDEEIYKELLDIANEMIPYVMKTESSGHSARSILRDSEVFANLLRFYDGICQWEEDSLTPILHIGWAKPLVNNITKFDYDIRSQVVIKMPEDVLAEERAAAAEREEKAKQQLQKQKEANNEAKLNIGGEVEGNNNNNLCQKKDEKLAVNDAKKSELPTTLADLTAACGEKILNPDFLLQGGGEPFAEQQQQQQQLEQQQNKPKQDAPLKLNNNNHNNINNNNNNNNNIKTNHNNESEANGLKKSNATAAPAPSPAAPISTVGNTITATTLNTVGAINNVHKAAVEQHPANERTKSVGTSAPETATTSCGGAMPTTTAAAVTVAGNNSNNISSKNSTIVDDEPFQFMLKRPIITLYSQKMKGLKDLLLAEKLNTHAISLQVTAQSVASRKVRGVDKLGHHTSISTYATVNVTPVGGGGGGGGGGGTGGGGSGGGGTGSATTDAGANASSGSAAAAAAASAAGDSIAASRPKRSRRE